MSTYRPLSTIHSPCPGSPRRPGGSAFPLGTYLTLGTLNSRYSLRPGGSGRNGCDAIIEGIELIAEHVGVNGFAILRFIRQEGRHVLAPVEC